MNQLKRLPTECKFQLKVNLASHIEDALANRLVDPVLLVFVLTVFWHLVVHTWW